MSSQEKKDYLQKHLKLSFPFIVVCPDEVGVVVVTNLNFNEEQLAYVLDFTVHQLRKATLAQN